MDTNKLREAIKQAKEASGKREFSQSVDMFINLKQLDLKKPEGKVEEFILLPKGRAKQAKICALIGPELKEQATKYCDQVILSDDFSKRTPRQNKVMARKNNFFIAQANIMPDIAKAFGKYLAPIGKMPNPKGGQIVPPKGNIEPTVSGLKQTVKLVNKGSPVIHCTIGNEKMSDEDLFANAIAIVERLKAKLPNGDQNLKNIVVKTTMGKSFKVM